MFVCVCSTLLILFINFLDFISVSVLLLFFPLFTHDENFVGYEVHRFESLQDNVYFFSSSFLFFLLRRLSLYLIGPNGMRFVYGLHSFTSNECIQLLGYRGESCRRDSIKNKLPNSCKCDFVCSKDQFVDAL